MHLLPHILASDDDTDTAMKIIFGVVAVMIWIIKVVISSISANKKEAETRRRQIIRTRPGYGGAMPQQQQRPARIPPPMVPVFNPKQRIVERNRPARRAQPPLKPVPLPAQIIDRPAPPARPVQAPARVANRPTADASRVARLLRRKDSLRAALILGEVLAPPVALRNVSPRPTSASSS